MWPSFITIKCLFVTRGNLPHKDRNAFSLAWFNRCNCMRVWPPKNEFVPLYFTWSYYFCSRTSIRSEEHTSELQSRFDLVCRLLPDKKKAPVRDSVPIAAEHT